MSRAKRAKAENTKPLQARTEHPDGPFGQKKFFTKDDGA